MPGLLHLLRRTLLTWACLPALAVAQSVPAVDPLPVETQLGLHLRDLEHSWEVIQGRSARPQQPVSSKQLSLPDDATCRQRLSSIQGVFVFDMYPRVRDFIEFFALRNAEGLEAVLGMSQQYKPGIERSLQQFNLPLNLRFLPIALSAMNTCALSEHGSAGLWQLNHYVAIRYGLQCTDAVDERRDFHRSTHAAMAYLSDLQKHYGNWMHTLTAFTNGPAALQRALLRSQGKTDFGSLYPHLPTEARDYVPAFVAACYSGRLFPRPGHRTPPSQLAAKPRLHPTATAPGLQGAVQGIEDPHGPVAATQPRVPDGVHPRPQFPRAALPAQWLWGQVLRAPGFDLQCAGRVGQGRSRRSRKSDAPSRSRHHHRQRPRRPGRRRGSKTRR
jgi:hypothetical protein